MNRQDRRLSKKEVKKNTQIINKLTPEQAKLLDMIVDQRINEYINNFNKLIDRNMTAALINYGVKYEDIEGIENDMSTMFMEDSKKSDELEREGLNLAKIDAEVRSAVREVLKNFTVKKLAIEELTYKFPKLSRSMLTTAYGLVEMELKKEIYEELEKLEDKSNSEEAVKFIMNKFGLINDNASKHYYSWRKDYLIPKTEIVVDKKIKENSRKLIDKTKEIVPVEEMKQSSIINKMEDVEMKKLLVLEEKVIKTIKVAGENGTYLGETDKGVVLSREEMSITFKNEEELDEWVAEFRQVLKMVM